MDDISKKQKQICDYLDTIVSEYKKISEIENDSEYNIRKVNFEKRLVPQYETTLTKHVGDFVSLMKNVSKLDKIRQDDIKKKEEEKKLRAEEEQRREDHKSKLEQEKKKEKEKYEPILQNILKLYKLNAFYNEYLPEKAEVVLSKEYIMNTRKGTTRTYLLELKYQKNELYVDDEREQNFDQLNKIFPEYANFEKHTRDSVFTVTELKHLLEYGEQKLQEIISHQLNELFQNYTKKLNEIILFCKARKKNINSLGEYNLNYNYANPDELSFSKNDTIIQITVESLSEILKPTEDTSYDNARSILSALDVLHTKITKPSMMERVTRFITGKGGKTIKNTKYVLTDKKVNIIYANKKIRRNIYLKGKAKIQYCKVDKKYVLLSKLKLAHNK